LNLSFDAGTLLFPISYIFGDILTEVYGYQRSRRVIWTGFAAAGLMSVTFWIIRQLPGEANWQSYAGDAAFDAILGGVSSGGIIIASLVAYLVGEFSNSFVLAKMKVAMQGRHLWMRTIGSTLVGEGVDSIVFVTIASAFGVFPWEITLSTDRQQLYLQSLYRSNHDARHLSRRRLPQARRARRLLRHRHRLQSISFEIASGGVA
jgi:uncharacterized integral membrane protein (TIGR00697 family)